MKRYLARCAGVGVLIASCAFGLALLIAWDQTRTKARAWPT